MMNKIERIAKKVIAGFVEKQCVVNYNQKKQQAVIYAESIVSLQSDMIRDIELQRYISRQSQIHLMKLEKQNFNKLDIADKVLVAVHEQKLNVKRGTVHTYFSVDIIFKPSDKNYEKQLVLFLKKQGFYVK